jgi:YVTN family beta-propeller protein
VKRFIHFLFGALTLIPGLFACLAVCVQPALATRLSAELKTAVQAHFPDARIRLDGAIETKSGQLYLPLSPPKNQAAEKTPKVPLAVQLKDKYPEGEPSDALFFSNGWCFLRVIKKGAMTTTMAPSLLTDSLRKQLYSSKFVPDLIVPDNFAVAKMLRLVVGDLAIAIVPDPLTKAKGPAPPANASNPSAAGNSSDPVKPATATNPDKPVERTAHGAVFVSSPGTGKITMLDGQTLEKLTEFPTEGTPAGMTCADGRLYIADQGKSRILVLDPKKRQFLGQIDLTPKSAPKGLASLPNGKLMYVSESAAGNVDVIETATGKVLLKTKVIAGPSKVVMAHNGNYLIVLNPPSGQATIMSTSNQKVLGVVKVGSMPNAAVFSKDSAFAYVSNRVSNTVTIIDMAKRQAVGNLQTGAGPTGLVFTNDGERLLVANAKDNTISVFDVAKRTKIQDIRLPLDLDFPSSLFLMPDGQRILVSSASTEALGILNVAKLEFESQPVIGHTSDEMLWLSLD